MIICERCGHVFCEDDIDIRREYHSEVPDRPYEDWAVCPYCGGMELEDLEMCELCGRYFVESDMIGGVCEECVNQARGDWRMCLDMSSRYESGMDVKINAFLATVFAPQEIEDILVAALEQRDKVNCDKYIDQDLGWFAEKLEEIKGEKK